MVEKITKNVVWESSNLNQNPDEENKLERQIISNGLKRKAVECECPSKLLHSYLRENSTNSITTQDNFKTAPSWTVSPKQLGSEKMKNNEERNEILAKVDQKKKIRKSHQNPMSK
ncbi:vitellogenin receptor [Aphis craccivora]|uniref:Vitellogenin receptor n=1 Tax=Aphis craccivora TaxID=307492 RepID=A0A6G0Y577_APHCR|nr:vitellogenin receptor [Aphis craccivora]